MADGRLAGSETMKATVTLNLDKVDLNVTIDGDVNLE